ncbi:MAG: oxaloacetate decarboxylase [Alphaproteobacteria bacterium]
MIEVCGQAKRLRAMVEAERTIWMAGAYDALSAKIIAQSGFEAVFTTGFGISASLLGQPDLELYTMTENLSVVSRIASAIPGSPVVADCDTGYGSVLNVQRTVRAFESAQVSGIVIEDQISPKICPCLGSVTGLLPIDLAVAKIRAACDARANPNTIIVARSDAIDMPECIARLAAYADAGADLVQPVSGCVKSIDDLRALRRKAKKPLSLQLLNWLEEDLSSQEIESVAGFAVYPLVPVLTVAEALRDNIARLASTHSSRHLPRGRTNMQDFAAMLGYSELRATYDRYAIESRSM